MEWKSAKSVVTRPFRKLLPASEEGSDKGMSLPSLASNCRISGSLLYCDWVLTLDFSPQGFCTCRLHFLTGGRNAEFAADVSETWVLDIEVDHCLLATAWMEIVLGVDKCHL